MNASDDADRPAVLPFASHRDLYLLVAGIVLGVLLSPAVLGRVAPSAYDRLFIGAGAAGAQLEAYERETEQFVDRLEATGVTDVAIDEQIERRLVESVPLQLQVESARAAHARWLTGRMMALVLAIAAVMVLEAVVRPQVRAGEAVRVSPAVGRLITVRYALVALWLALVIAQPALLTTLPLLFTLLVVAVALAAAFVPLGPRREAPNN